jgi:hypothetical protein
MIHAMVISEKNTVICPVIQATQYALHISSAALTPYSSSNRLVDYRHFELLGHSANIHFRDLIW